jgi:hypothetical protein
MARLDLQRNPARLHQRLNYRLHTRGYNTTPHAVWGDSGSVVPPAKGQAAPGTIYPSEATVTAQDSTNAAKLAGLGYVAQPLTDWLPTQKITVGAFNFYWNGSIWVAGAHP